MNALSPNAAQTQSLIDGLRRSEAYPHNIVEPIELQQTHISIVFLAGDFAYKIKKPVKTDFLDYSTLERRKYFCEEEVRLDSRYASDLYLGVVPVTSVDGQLAIGGDGEVVDYAVKMRRFPTGSLLSERIEMGQLTGVEVVRLAEAVARFHETAEPGRGDMATGWPTFLVRNNHQIIDTLQRSADSRNASTLKVLGRWSNKFFRQHLGKLSDRVDAGFVRECHGDLHLANVVHWGDQLVPFDGIEFNDRLRWIDVLSDAAFLAMDMAARDHLHYSRSFMNAYLESTGDYESLELLRLFLMYRSLVRALAASMRSDGGDVQTHVELAHRFTLQQTRQLWITHGLSGSGKTTRSEAVVQRSEAIRVRSDMERKRMFGLAAKDRPSAERAATMYGDEANERTYRRLADLAAHILRAGYSVVIDATFLRSADRRRFHNLANQHLVGFAILDCQCDPQTLRQRVADRAAGNNDASDADLMVLENQLARREPLTSAELDHVVDVPDPVQIATHP